MFDDLPHWKPVIFKSLERAQAGIPRCRDSKALRYDVVEDPLPRYFHKRWDLVKVEKTALETGFFASRTDGLRPPNNAEELLVANT